MMLNPNRKVLGQRGLSLIEASMVLALSAVVVAGAVMYYGSASANSKVQKAQSQIAAIQSAVGALYANQATYAGLTEVMLQKELPASFYNGAKLVDPWTKDMTIAVDGTDPRNWTITYTEVPEAACVKLATNDFGTGLKKVVIDTTTFTPAAPATVDTATTACAAAPTKGMVFTFK